MEDREPPQTCATCNNVVQGSFNGIKLSVCCADCCAKTTTDRGYYAVVSKRAVQEFHCKNRDLAWLRSKEKILNRFGYRSKLYLLAEVKHLGQVRREMDRRAQAEKELKQRPTLIKRRRILLKTLNLTPTEFAEEDKRIAMIFLLGDYLRRWQPKTKLQDVQERWKVFPRVQEILQNCPEAHPDAAFDFCMRYRHAGSAEFLHAKKSVQQVFHLFGDRIMSCLESTLHFDLRHMLDTPLENEYVHFRGRYKREIRFNLLKCVSPVIADEIMIHPISQKHIQQGRHEPEVANRLLEAWNTRHEHRKRPRSKTNRGKTASAQKRQRS